MLFGPDGGPSHITPTPAHENNPWEGPKKAAESFDQGHAVADGYNFLNQHNGWTQGAAKGNQLATQAETAANSAKQAEHLAENADLMGNDRFALKFGLKAQELEGTAAGLETASEEARGPLNSLLEGPAGKVLGGAGVALGGYNTYQDFSKGNYTQGAMDGISTGLAGAALVQPELAPAAAVAALAASGNQLTQEWGLWGKGKDGKNLDSLQWVGNETSNAYNSVDKWAGGGVTGAIAGGAAAGLTGIGTGATALVTDVGAGAYGLGKSAYDGLNWLGEKENQGLNWLGNQAVNIGSSAVNTVENFGSSALKGAGSVVSSIASW